MGAWKEPKGELLFFALVFLSLFVFFTEVHPLVMFDGDDWVNMSKQRNIAFPKWHDFNPVKVLPESLMPLAASVAAYFVLPFLGDLVSSMMVVSAVLMAGLITVYVYLVVQVLKSRFSISSWVSCLLGGIFLLFHFLIFRHGDYNNAYLFWAINLTNYYHYTMPALLNASLVLYFIWKDVPGDRRMDFTRFEDCLLVFLLFLALCSNVLHSILLAGYALIDVLWNFRAWKTRRFSLGIIIAWLLTLLFEATGGRAGQIGSSLMDLPVGQTALAFFHVVVQDNKGIYMALAFAVLFLGGSVVLWLRRKEKDSIDAMYRSIQLKMLSLAVLWAVYEILVCAKAGGSYIVWPQVVIGFFFCLFFLMTAGAAYVFCRKPQLLAVLLILSLVIFCRTINAEQSLAESTVNGVPPAICMAVTRDMISQVQEAEHQGAARVELHVPKGNDIDNWPHPNYMGPAVCRLLYGQGIIPYPIEIVIVPDMEMNRKHGMK